MSSGKPCSFNIATWPCPRGPVSPAASSCWPGGAARPSKDGSGISFAPAREKHPLEYRNAGSVFKNPKGMPAGKIIEEAGLKGTRIGGAQVSEKHGNFIVNLGSATARDIIGLIELVQKKVLEAKGIALEPEVKIIGEE